MTAQWLRHDDSPIQPVELDSVRRLLVQLDDTIAAAAKTRNGLEDSYKPGHPLRDLALAELRESVEAEADDLKARIAAAFNDAQQRATANINAARAAFARSDEGRDYLAALPGYAAMANALPPDALAERLNGLIDSGLIGQARALAEVAQPVTRKPGVGGQLQAAIFKAKAEAKTPTEAAVEADAAYIASAAANAKLLAGQLPNRLDEALTSGRDYAAGNFANHVL